jgi:hypothetical protein
MTASLTMSHHILYLHNQKQDFFRYRHWWVGPCENLGTNSGYAYMEIGFDCPKNSGTWMNVEWRRGGSDQRLSGIQNKFSGCHDIFDDNGRKTEVRINFFT